MPVEATVPYVAFKDAGFDVKFATEKGKAPECDKLLIEGLGQKLLVRCSALMRYWFGVANEHVPCREPRKQSCRITPR